jgi:hypothetical protein
MARQSRSGALNLLADTDIHDEHLVGLKKRVYLYWARSEVDEVRRAQIAKEGFDVALLPGLENNVPVLVTSIKLARLAREDSACETMLGKLRQINAAVASIVATGADVEAARYWEKDSFEPLLSADVEAGIDRDADVQDSPV